MHAIDMFIIYVIMFLICLISIPFVTTRFMRIKIYSSINQRHICLVGFMVFNAIFNTISVMSWQSVLLVDETRVPGENLRISVCHLTNFITQYCTPRLRTHNSNGDRHGLHREL